MSRAAVVVNPTKLDDDETFGKTVRRVMDDHGWDEPLWLETTLEDPGPGQAGRVLGAGSAPRRGDGSPKLSKIVWQWDDGDYAPGGYCGLCQLEQPHAVIQRSFQHLPGRRDWEKFQRRLIDACARRQDSPDALPGPEAIRVLPGSGKLL